MTGTEAISNGVPAFKSPESVNARATLVWMGVLLGSMFLGLSYLAVNIGVLPADDETVISQIGRTVFGAGPLWVMLQVATALILILAANTSFADFPRLSSILARDRFMPRLFQFRGDRLAFTTGIVALAVLSIVLLVVFEGSLDALIPLYAIGVFTSFTLSQAGMVVHWRKLREPGLAALGRHQQRGCGSDCRRDGCHRGDEIRRWRVVGHRADPDADCAVLGHPPPLPESRTRAPRRNSTPT